MAPALGGMAQAELTWVPGSPPKWFACAKTVAHPRMSTVFNDVTLHYAVLWVYLNMLLSIKLNFAFSQIHI